MLLRTITAVSSIDRPVMVLKSILSLQSYDITVLYRIFPGKTRDRKSVV